MFVVGRTLLAAAFLGTVMSAAQTRATSGRALPDPSPPLLSAQDGSATDWDGIQDGRCVFAICGPDLRLCEPGQMPLAEVRVHLRDRHRCPGHRAVSVMGMAAKFECDPAHRPFPSTTKTTLPECAPRTDPDGTLVCVDGCPCDFNRRRDGACVIAIFCSENCKLPGLECRRGHVVPVQPYTKVVVPVGQSRVIRDGIHSIPTELRCVSR